MAPDSRKSDRTGRLSVRLLNLAVELRKRNDGNLQFLASALRLREISEISNSRDSFREECMS